MPYQLIIEIEKPGSYHRFNHIDDFVKHQLQVVNNCPSFLAKSFMREIEERTKIERQVETRFSLPANSLKGINLLFSSPEQAIANLTEEDLAHRLAHSSTLVHIAVSKLQGVARALVISRDKIIRKKYRSNSFPLPGL